MLKRLLIFVVIFLMGMSCVHFGGVEPYTSDFGFGMLLSFFLAGVVAVLFTEDIQHEK
jgi:1,4-dihydroxy-2-naphthoate octaprenyltransferase|tara:strand:- start:524 stop:697 length:174 start_codon:yes stop_codon:yes gene_type:complete